MKGLRMKMISVVAIMGIMTGCSAKTIKVSGEDVLGKSKVNSLMVQGKVEAKEVNINTKIAGKVAEIKVKEGDTVKKGDVLIAIGNETLLAKQAQNNAQMEAAAGSVRAAEAARNAALALSEKAENGAREQEIAQAKAAFDFATVSYNRVHTLFLSKMVSQSQEDEAATKLEATKQTYEMAKQGARSEDKLAAKAQVEQANSMVEAAKGKLAEAQGGSQEVQSYLADSVIVAPTDGTVTALNTEVGELVSTGMPLLAISKMTEQWIEVNVKETDLKNVVLDKVVTIKLPAYGTQEFKGKVVRINEKPDFATKRATNDNGEYDIISFGVKIEFTSVDKPLHPGMTAIVDFGKRDDK